MRIIKCDKCGKEVGELDINIIRINHQWSKPKNWFVNEEQEYCNECYEKFEEILKDFNNIELKTCTKVNNYEK